MFIDEIITNLGELQSAHDRFRATETSWLFRGQRDATWNLKSSLERAAERFGIDLKELRDFELRLSREFKRHFHRYSSYRPRDADFLEWLSIMQHHGTPTRLLDFTYSFNIALFFAIESAGIDDMAVIWAVHYEGCTKTVLDAIPAARQKLDKDDKCPEGLQMILESDVELACPLNPMNLNERLAVQQGIFVACCNPQIPLQRAIENTLQSDQIGRVRIVCTKELLLQILQQLQRVNINRVSLFPGLDGFARNLENTMPLKYLWKHANINPT